MIYVFGASYATSAAMKNALSVAANDAVTLFGKVGASLNAWAAEEIAAAGSLRGKVAVVLELGGNGVPSAEDVRRVDAQLRANGANRVVWFYFTDWPVAGAVKTARAACGEIVKANAELSVALPTPSASEVASDGVHLTSTGYAALGRSIASGLSNPITRPGDDDRPNVFGFLAVCAACAFAGYVVSQR